LNKIKLIYILGLGHSGSTLLDFILGSHSKFESVGEIKILESMLRIINYVPAVKKFLVVSTGIILLIIMIV